MIEKAQGDLVFSGKFHSLTKAKWNQKCIVFSNTPPEFYKKRGKLGKLFKTLSLDRWKVYEIRKIK